MIRKAALGVLIYLIGHEVAEFLEWRRVRWDRHVPQREALDRERRRRTRYFNTRIQLL